MLGANGLTARWLTVGFRCRRDYEKGLCDKKRTISRHIHDKHTALLNTKYTML